MVDKMANPNITMLDNKQVEIDFAREFKESVAKSIVPIKFTKGSLKNKIEKADDNQLLVVISTINSPKLIESVELYDKAYIKNSL
jgi:hypothetical protein